MKKKMNRIIKKIISSFLILGFLFNVVLPIREASAMTAPWWSGSQGSDSTGVAYASTGESSLNDNRKNQEQAVDPVSVHNGDFIYQHQDLLIPSRAMSLEISRIYKSQSRYNNRFGYGWDISYNKKIVPLCTGDLYYLNGKLNRYRFVYVDGTNYISPKGVYDIIVQNVDGTYTLTEKHGTAYEFDQNGILTEIRDRNGNSLHFSYDPDGKGPIIGKSVFSNDPNPKVIAYDYKLIKISDTVGREITLTYDSNGRLENIVDFSGRAYSYTYDPSDNGDLISFTTPQTAGYPAGFTTTYSYTDHNLQTITDAKGETYLTNYYDESDRVYQQDYGVDRFVFSYDTLDNRTTITSPKGFVTEWSYDSDGSPITKEEYTAGLRPTDPAFYTTSYQYNNNLECTSITYPAGNGIKYTYDEGNLDLYARGNLLEVRRKPDMTQPDDGLVDLVTAFTYEPRFNFIKTITDPKGNVTTYTYDYELAPADPNYGEKGNLIRITYPVVDAVTPEVNFTYNAYGQVETVTDPNGNVTRYVYYPATGYLKQIINDYGIEPANLNYISEMTYDAVGNTISIKNARDDITSFQYNALNQLTQVTSPAPFNYVTKYQYDENGNLKKLERQVDAAGTVWQSTSYVYDILDRLETITDNLNNVTTFSYDANGNRTFIQDAEQNITTYEYDERDLLWKVTDALDNTTEYAYDENGNLKQIKDARLNKTTYVYDDFDRLITTTYEDATTETYSYDKNSNLWFKTDQNWQTITYDYDALNRLTLKKYHDLSTIQYQYDAASRLTDVTDSTGTIHYDYDTVNHVTQVTYPDTNTVGYEYDAVGNRTKLTYPDSSYISYEYDQLNRLASIKDQASNTIASYAYDVLSRRNQLDLANNAQAAYQYDNINRLINLANQDAALATISSYDYTYDNAGNRLTMQTTEGTHNYTYDDIYQLTNVTYPDTSSATYDYDDLGNRTSVVDGGTTAYVPNNMNQYDSVGGASYTWDNKGNLTNDATYTYSYDYENRLTSATKTGMSATYTYDAFGRRIQKDVDNTITNYIYDGDQVIVETDAAGSTLAKYIYGPGIDEPISMERGGQTYYYHFDGLGSVTALTDSSGSTVESYTYDVFGQPDTTSSVGNPYMFTGRRLDAETGLYYYRNRYYNNNIGRFLSRDPIGFFDDINPYRYVSNNPVNYIDPYGWCKEANKGIFEQGYMYGPDGRLIGATGPEDPAPRSPRVGAGGGWEEGYEISPFVAIGAVGATITAKPVIIVGAIAVAGYGVYQFSRRRPPFWDAPGMPGQRIKQYEQRQQGAFRPPPNFRNLRDRIIWIISQTFRIFRNILGGG